MRALLPLTLTLSLVACEQPPPPVPGAFPTADNSEVLATVDGITVTVDMRDTMLKQMPAQMREQLEQSGQLAQLDEQLVIGELLYREALERKLHEDPEVARLVAMTTRSVLADKALDAVLSERLTEAEIQKAYDERAVQFKRPQAKVRVIAVQDETEAAAVKARLDAGEDFAAVATSASKDPRTASKGGELGWMSERDIAPTFKEQVFGAEKGAVIGPLAAGNGQVFFFVEDKRDAVPLSEVRDELEQELKTSLRDAYFEELKSKATISKGGGGAELTVPAPEGAPADPAGAQ